MQKTQQLVYGFGTNDSPTPISWKTNGSFVSDRFYVAWSSMLRRCYDLKHIARKPTYAGCTVTDEWHSFTTFRDWMLDQDYEGKQLDKDIIYPGNKVYTRDRCCFVSVQLNTLLNDNCAIRGDFPQGVVFDRGKFRANIKKRSKTHYLGRFDTQEEASAVYRTAKSDHITEIAYQQTDPRIREGLLAHAGLIA